MLRQLYQGLPTIVLHCSCIRDYKICKIKRLIINSCHTVFKKTYFSINFVHIILHKWIYIPWSLDHFLFFTSCTQSHHFILTVSLSTIPLSFLSIWNSIPLNIWQLSSYTTLHSALNCFISLPFLRMHNQGFNTILWPQLIWLCLPTISYLSQQPG